MATFRCFWSLRMNSHKVSSSRFSLRNLKSCWFTPDVYRNSCLLKNQLVARCATQCCPISDKGTLRKCLRESSSMGFGRNGNCFYSLGGGVSFANFATNVALATAEKVDDKASSSSSQNKEEELKKKREFQQKATKYSLLALFVSFSGLAGYLVAMWGSPKIDEDGNEVKDEFNEYPTWRAYLSRTWKEIIYYNQMIKEPSREKLLPDPLTDPYFQPPYTLVIEMTGVLVHPDWTYKTGWRFKKRPGVEFLLQQVGPPMYEIVIYTSEQGFTAFPIIDSLDPNGYIMYRLFRDATRYQNNHHVKDLACLNRDLSRVIFVDWNEKSFQLQPENALKLKKWTGNDDDRKLFDLAMFLRTVATGEVEDVRTVLQFYNSFDDPLEAFKENQRRLQEEQEKMMKAEANEKSQRLTESWTPSLFGRRR